MHTLHQHPPQRLDAIGTCLVPGGGARWGSPLKQVQGPTGKTCLSPTLGLLGGSDLPTDPAPEGHSHGLPTVNVFPDQLFRQRGESHPCLLVEALHFRFPVAA